MKWGIMATGGIAASFASDLLLHNFEVCAVGSRTQDSADRFAERFSIPRAHGSYLALVNDPDVDAVYISTPHPMHAENARLALEHGKHVLVEKAFTVNAAEAASVITLAQQRGLVVMEAMWARFLPHMVRLREILAAQQIGHIRSVIADHTQDITDDPNHRLNALELGGGALLDLGIYPISFTWDVLGKPASIKASAVFKPTGADAQIATIATYASGALAVTVSGSDTAGRNIATIHGTKGRIEIDSPWNARSILRLYDERNNLIETFHKSIEGRGMQYEAAEFERRVQEGETSDTILPSSETLQIMNMLDTVRQQIGLRYPME